MPAPAHSSEELLASDLGQEAIGSPPQGWGGVQQHRLQEDGRHEEPLHVRQPARICATGELHQHPAAPQERLYLSIGQVLLGLCLGVSQRLGAGRHQALQVLCDLHQREMARSLLGPSLEKP